MIGGIAALVALVGFIVAHEAGHYFAARATGMKVTEAFIGFGPRIWSFKRGETEYGIKPIPFGAYVKILGMNSLEDVDPAEEDRTYRSKPFWAKSLAVLSGVIANFLIAFLIFSTVAMVEGEPVVVDGEPVLTTQVSGVVEADESGQPTAAALAGLEAGDVIVAIDGNPVTGWEDLRDQIEAAAGEQVVLLVERENTQVELTTTMGSRIDPDSGETVGFLGFAPAVATQDISVLEAAWIGTRQVGVAVEFTFESFARILRFDTLGQLFGGITGGEIDPDVRPVSPIGIVQIGSQAEEFGWVNVVLLLAFVNVILGTLNALPLYPLDGGHFAVALYEKVTGRTADVRKLIPIALTVIGVIGVIGLLAIILDIVNPIDL
ncbi:MAG: M50 family metallopeptidase [Acidimicrobiia bacterium]|nr:M50 family metallopeptidase [Acidimicrobiia bacterium]